jgi:beta-lactamase regulating signal transducer with metallopeptidase domain
MAELLATWVPALGAALLHFLWQGALVGVVAALLLHALRDARPQARYAVACVALLACLALPALTLLLPWLNHAMAGLSGAAPAAMPVVAGAPQGPAPAFAVISLSTAPGMDPWLPWIVAAWAAGACAMSLRMAMGLAWIRRLPTADDGVQQLVWQARLDVLAGHFGLRREVALRLVHGLDTPAVSGWLRPVVLLPVALLARMPADLVEALLAHELAHVRRHDYLVNLLQNAVEALLFYHPVTWWLSHRIRVEREQIADQLAAEVACAPRRLATALSELADFQRDDAVELQWLPAARGGQLMARVQTLLRPAGRAHPAARVVFPLLGLVAASVATYSFAAIDAPDARAPAAVVEPASALEPEAPTAAEAALEPEAPTAAEAVLEPAPVAEAEAALTRADAEDAAADVAVHPTGRVDIAVRNDGQLVLEADDARVEGRLHDKDDGEFHAVVHKRGKSIQSHGSLDMAAIRLIERQADGDFLWFRRGGKDFVVTDPDVIARARAAWRETEALGEQMEPLSRQMQVHSEHMQALGERMQALSQDATPSPAMLAAEKRMRELAREERGLARDQREIEAQLDKLHDADAPSDDPRLRELERRNDALAGKMEALEQQMRQQERVIDAEDAVLEQRQAPMDALSEEMERASEPMDALGKQMDAIGRRIDVAARKAEVQVRAIIDEAVAHDLHRPAVVR